MLLYHNRRSLRVFLQLTGSVFQNVVFTTCFLLIYAFTLIFLLRRGYLTWFMEQGGSSLRNAYAPQAFGVLSAFVVCFRTNIAWSRYWEACEQSTLMFVKWGDAYSQIVGFCNTTLAFVPASDNKKRSDIGHWKCVLAHWFSLLAAFATERLIHGDIEIVEERDKTARWAERVIRREDLRRLTQADQNRRPLPKFTSYDLVESHQIANRAGGDINHGTRWRQLYEKKKSAGPSIPTLIALSEEEKRGLLLSNDRCFRVFGWVFEGATRLNRFLDIPPPIFSRVFQELGAGNVGFHQAKKLSDIPFPFIFTQLLAWMIFFACLLVPIFAAQLSFQQDEEPNYFTVALSVMVCVPLVGLNEVSKELENPFGLDANDVPLMEGLERFVESLLDSYFTKLPTDHLPLTREESDSIYEAMDLALAAREKGDGPPVLDGEKLAVPLLKLKAPARQTILFASSDSLDHELLTNVESFVNGKAHTVSKPRLENMVRKVRTAMAMTAHPYRGEDNGKDSNELTVEKAQKSEIEKVEQASERRVSATPDIPADSAKYEKKEKRKRHSEKRHRHHSPSSRERSVSRKRPGLDTIAFSSRPSVEELRHRGALPSYGGDERRQDDTNARFLPPRP